MLERIDRPTVIYHKMSIVAETCARRASPGETHWLGKKYARNRESSQRQSTGTAQACQSLRTRLSVHRGPTRQLHTEARPFPYRAGAAESDRFRPHAGMPPSTDTLKIIRPRHVLQIAPIDLAGERLLLSLRRGMERFVIRLAAQASLPPQGVAPHRTRALRKTQHAARSTSSTSSIIASMR